MLMLEWHVDNITIKILSGHRGFIINMLMGIFTGCVLAIISLIVLYVTLKEKIKAKVNYKLQQLCDEMKTFELYLKLTSFKTIEEKNAVILKVYQEIFELSTIFIELSLDEAKTLYGNEVFDIMNDIKRIIGQLGIDIYRSPNKTNELIEVFLKGFKPHIKKLEAFYKDAI